MSLIISFAWTTDALLAGAKTCTRRSWSSVHARVFHGWQVVEAWDKLPYAGGHHVADIVLIEAPYLSAEYPEGDYEREGLAWMEKQGRLIKGQSPRVFWEEWRAKAPSLWVVRFELREMING